MTRRTTGLRSMAWRVAALVCALATISAVQSDRQVLRPALRPAPRFSVGDAFPLVALPALEGGRARSIADFRGQKLILHVFASW